MIFTSCQNILFNPTTLGNKVNELKALTKNYWAMKLNTYLNKYLIFNRKKSGFAAAFLFKKEKKWVLKFNKELLFF